MAKQHKYHNSYIEIDSALSAEKTLDLARRTVESQRGLKLGDEHDGAFSVLLKSIVGVTVLHFTVRAIDGDGGSLLVTRIEQYRTSQSTVFFIPIGPKSLEGYPQYRRYMNALAQVVQAAEGSARYTIKEIEGAA